MESTSAPRTDSIGAMLQCLVRIGLLADGWIVRVRRRASRTSRAELPPQTAHYEINGSHVTIFLGDILTSQSM